MARVTRCDVCGYVGEYKEFKTILLDATQTFRAKGNTRDLCLPCHQS